MEHNRYEFRKIGTGEAEAIKALFVSVFTEEPWNDDWSNAEQLEAYINDLTGQSCSLAYGLYEGGALIGVSMGRIWHWYSGTEYYIDEFCIKTAEQGKGIGTFFLKEIEKAIKELGMTQMFLQTARDVPAYEFYVKNGFYEMKEYASLAKEFE